MASSRHRNHQPPDDDDDDYDESMQQEIATPVQCSVKLCQADSAGRGPYSKMVMCQRHLAVDIAKVRKFRASVLERASAAIASAEAFRPKQLRLAAELQEMTDVFDSLHRALDRWQERLTRPIEAQHEAVKNHLQIGNECRVFQRDLAAADSAGDLQRVFELATSVEPLLDAAGIEVDAPDAAALALPTSAIDVDVSGAVKNLLVPLDSELGHLTGLLEGSRDQQKPARRDPSCYAEFAGCLDGFEAPPVWLAVCSNTAGFGPSPDRKRLVKAVGTASALPKQLVFVAFNADNRLDYIAAVSVNGRVRLKIEFTGGVNIRAGVYGLHCDDTRQLLYISVGSDGVCVTDLAGTAQQRITAASLGLAPSAVGNEFRVSGLAGTPDKLFVHWHRERTVLVIGKKDLALHARLSLGPGSDTFDGGLAVTMAADASSSSDDTAADGSVHSMLFVCDWVAQCVHRLCPASGYRLAPPLCAKPLIEAPYAVVADCRRGVAFVSDFRKQCVRVLLLEGGCGSGASGRDWQAPLEGPPLDAPAGLAVADIPDGPTLLLVADSAQNRIATFTLL